MKFSFNTISTFVTLATLLSSSVARMSSPVKKDSKTSILDSMRSITLGITQGVALPEAFHRQLQISQLSEKKRHLQELSPDCDEAMNDLYNNTQLVEAAQSYYENYLVAIMSNIATSCSVEEDIVCNFQQLTIPGQQELESACMAVGGQVIAVPLDSSCNINMEDGIAYNLTVDAADIIGCIATKCEEEVQATIGEAAMDTLEAALFEFGDITAECNAM